MIKKHPSELVIVEIDAFLAGDNSPCHILRRGLETHSAVFFEDSRVPDHNECLGLFMDYFAQSPEALMEDARPAIHYEVGVTPPDTEKARDHSPLIQTWPRELWPHIAPQGFRDPKWRYMHQVCKAGTKANFEQVVPRAFEDRWERVTNHWGQALTQSIETIARMLAVSYGLPENAFSRLLEGATHILAPNGIRLDLKEIIEGLILNQFHYDLNFGTAHGASSAPGLRIWFGNEVMTVRVPKGLLLFQAGKQLEWMTGGQIKAGYHEVVVLPETLEARDRLIAAGLPPVRSGTTLFGEGAWRRMLAVHEYFLRGLSPFERQQILGMYPSVPVSYQALGELYQVGLAKRRPSLRKEMKLLLPGEMAFAVAA